MAEATFEKQIMNKLEHMEKNISYIKEHIEDSRLSDEEKQLLEESYKHEKDGKLVSSKELKKRLAQWVLTLIMTIDQKISKKNSIRSEDIARSNAMIDWHSHPSGFSALSEGDIKYNISRLGIFGDKPIFFVVYSPARNQTYWYQMIRSPTS